MSCWSKKIFPRNLFTKGADHEDAYVVDELRKDVFGGRAHGWLELDKGDVIYKAIGMRLTHAEASSCNAVVLGFGLGFASCCDFFFWFLIWWVEYWGKKTLPCSRDFNLNRKQELWRERWLPWPPGRNLEKCSGDCRRGERYIDWCTNAIASCQSKSVQIFSVVYIEWHRPYSDQTTPRPPPRATTATATTATTTMITTTTTTANTTTTTTATTTTLPLQYTVLVPYAISIATVVAVSTS